MEINVALEKLRTICSRQEKCPSDIINLLKRWDIASDQHKQIIERLKAEKFIDEQRYASAFARDKVKFDHWGMIKIRMMLRQKGIDNLITEEVLKEINRDDYRAMIGNELKKKRKSLKGTSWEIWAKLARYGASRGYEMEFMEAYLGESGE
jgi:regulatory protein